MLKTKEEVEKDKVIATVRFNGASKEQIQWGGCDDPNPFLKVGVLYGVVDIEVHSYHTKIQIYGVKGKFNSASFDWLDNTPVLERAMEAWRRERRLGNV